MPEVDSAVSAASEPPLLGTSSAAALNASYDTVHLNTFLLACIRAKATATHMGSSKLNPVCMLPHRDITGTSSLDPCRQKAQPPNIHHPPHSLHHWGLTLKPVQAQSPAPRRTPRPTQPHRTCKPPSARGA